jgi:hypothetical protein
MAARRQSVNAGDSIFAATDFKFEISDLRSSDLKMRAPFDISYALLDTPFVHGCTGIAGAGSMMCGQKRHRDEERCLALRVPPQWDSIFAVGDLKFEISDSQFQT